MTMDLLTAVDAAKAEARRELGWTEPVLRQAQHKMGLYILVLTQEGVGPFETPFWLVRELTGQVQAAHAPTDEFSNLTTVYADETLPLLAAFNPNQPRDWRGRWTTGMGWGGHVQPQIYGFTSSEAAYVENALERVKGKTSKVLLHGVVHCEQAILDPASENPSAVVAAFAPGESEIRLGPQTWSREVEWNFHRDTDIVRARAVKRTPSDSPTARAFAELDQMVDNFHSPTGDAEGPMAVIAHEFGHAAKFSMTPTQQRGALDAFADAIGVARPREETSIEGWARLYNWEIRRAVSGYAARGSEELFAEAWAEYILHDAPRPGAAALGRSMEEALT